MILLYDFKRNSVVNRINKHISIDAKTIFLWYYDRKIILFKIFSLLTDFMEIYTKLGESTKIKSMVSFLYLPNNNYFKKFKRKN